MNWFRHIFASLFSSRKRTILVIVFLGALAGLSWWMFRKPVPSVQYQTSKVERGTIVSSITASGRVQTANIVNITTGASGVVKKVYVKDGDKVVSGQKISELTLDTQGRQKQAQAWASYLSAKNSLESAKATAFSLHSDMLAQWKTYMDLAQSGSYQNDDGSPKSDARMLPQFYASYDDWLATEAKYKNQQAVITQAGAALTSSWLSYQSTSSIITAPIAGTVGNVGLVEGMVLAAQTSASSDPASATQARVAVIQNDSRPLVNVSLTEIDVPKITLGQKATVTLDSISDKTFTGVVVAIDRIGSTSNNVTNYPATVQLDTATQEILPNMAANANIILNAKSNVLMVPSAAISTQGTQSVIRVLRNGLEQQVPVQLGLSSDTNTEVTSGVSEGDDVVIGTVAANATTSRTSTSVFGGAGFGGVGGLRPGGFGGGGAGGQRRD